jgi:hypothetical protein
MDQMCALMAILYHTHITTTNADHMRKSRFMVFFIGKRGNREEWESAGADCEMIHAKRTRGDYTMSKK